MDECWAGWLWLKVKQSSTSSFFSFLYSTAFFAIDKMRIFIIAMVTNVKKNDEKYVEAKT